MSRYWSRIAQKCGPYTPGEQPRRQNFIKLNTNENPYPPSEAVIKAIHKALDELRLYPDPESLDLRQAIAGYYGLHEDQVFVGNGSDEVLAFAFQAFFDPDKPVLFPEITYTFYPVYARLYGLSYQTVEQDENLAIPVESFCTGTAGGIVIANPNAPTGLLLPLDSVERIIAGNPQCVVIIDEAYVDFGGASAVSLIAKYPNLLVVQTFSKSRNLAGLRVGFALGQQELITALNQIKNSFNSYPLDRLAQAGAAAAIRDREYFAEITAKVIKTREWVIPALRELGFQVPDSRTNFVFISHPEIPGAQLFQLLRERGILVRYYNQPRIENYLRVTIGTDEEMHTFLRELSRIIKNRCAS